MSDDKSSKYRNPLPAIDAETGFTMAPVQIKEIENKILSKSSTSKGSPCSWCGQVDWKVSSAVYTNTLFDVVKNGHVSNMVDAFVLLGCNNCGHQIQFSLASVGLGTKGKGNQRGRSQDQED